MIFYISEVKKKTTLFALSILPVILGLMNNFVLFTDNTRLTLHLPILAFPIVQIIGALTSLFMFRGKKRVYTYIYCIVLIIYTEIIVFEGLLFGNDKFGFLSAPTVLLYIFYLYGFYPCFVGISRAFNIVRYNLHLALGKINIHIVSEKLETEIESEKIDNQSKIHHVYDLKKEFEDFSRELSDVNTQINNHIERLGIKLRSFENEALTLKQGLLKESEALIQVKREVGKLEKIKNISEEQIDLLLEKQNENAALKMVIGFVIGIISSLIAAYTYTLFTNFKF